MFNGEKTTMKLGGVNAQVIDGKGKLERITTLTFVTDLTKEVASGISKEVATLQELIYGGGVKSANVPMDGVDLKATLSDGDNSCEVSGRGVKADLKRATKEDAVPTMKFDLAFETEHDALVYCVDHLEQSLTVELTRVQLELPVE